jgi:hypothetical protein
VLGFQLEELAQRDLILVLAREQEIVHRVTPK